MNLTRIAKHFMMTPWQVNRDFPNQCLIAIENAIHASESAHYGEIRFVVEAALDAAPLFRRQSARERAIDVFSLFRLWDTEHNTGVLIYLLLADRDVEIVADRGIHAKVGPREWESICRAMEVSFGQANYEGGVVGGIEAVTRHLVTHFPSSGADRNELPNNVLVL